MKKKDKKFSEMGKKSWDMRQLKRDMFMFMAGISKSGVEARKKRKAVQ